MTPGQREVPAHQPALALRSDGGWGVYCVACSEGVQDYVYPCRNGSEFPPARLYATPGCDNDPIECNHEAALGQAVEERDAAVSALTRVRVLAEAAQQKGAALSSLPTDCSGACMDGECNCSGLWQRHAWKLDPAEVLAALPPVDSPEDTDG